MDKTQFIVDQKGYSAYMGKQKMEGEPKKEEAKAEKQLDASTGTNPNQRKKQENKKKQKKQQPPKDDGQKDEPARDWSALRLFDIAANMTDATFRGEYRGKQAHINDWDIVMKRARQYGVQKFLFAAGSLEDAQESLQLSSGSADYYSTIGVHPCRATEPYKGLATDAPPTEEAKDAALKEYFEKMRAILLDQKNREKMVAIGECGLDYDRFEYAGKEDQLKAFPLHFALTEEFKLPMYLHSRATDGEFAKIIKENRHRFTGGVVHSFTGDEQELKELLEMGLYIGINGCSLKTKENCELVRQIPLDRIMLETDCPYCDIRNSHYSMQFVKSKFSRTKKENNQGQCMSKDRNEPCAIVQVAEVVSALLGVSEEELCAQAWKNTLELFQIKDEES